MTSDSQAQADALYRERGLRARQMTPEERMLEGVRMFESVREAVRAALSKMMADASGAELTEAVRHYIHLARDQERGLDFYGKLRYLAVP